MDIEKWSHSLDHNFQIFTLEKYGFGLRFILWVKILVKDHDFCVINDGITTKQFFLFKGWRYYFFFKIKT